MFRLVARSFLNMIYSGILSLVTMALLFAVAQFLSSNFSSLYFIRVIGGGLLNALPNGLGVVFMWAALFIFYYLLLMWMLFSYFGKVNDTVRRMADGELTMNYQIGVRERHPFGPAARNVNHLSRRLQLALEEERLAEQTKNELITNVSHDLRTPLTSVVGYLGLIDQDRYRDEVELRHYVSIAYDKSQRLNELINDLFEYTRMRNDTAALRLEPINLSELLGQLLMQYHMQLQEAGMESELLGAESAVMVRADTAKLVRVFENLISNAMVYGQDGGRIDVSVVPREREVQVEVVNYGEPIPVYDLPHVFDRFYRGDKSRTQWSGGSGLGLAISKSIVEKHGGAISAHSDAKRTAFRVVLPRV